MGLKTSSITSQIDLWPCILIINFIKDPKSNRKVTRAIPVHGQLSRKMLQCPLAFECAAGQGSLVLNDKLS